MQQIMITQSGGAKFKRWTGRTFLAVLCALLVTPGDTLLYAQQGAAPAEQAVPKIPNDQLDSLVAPIALYPDPLLSQVLVASTYPLEIIQLQQWLEKHKDLKDKALVDAVQKEDWDPSIQAMAALPDVVNQLAENIKWTTDLGNAFLAQQDDVMDAVQRMRTKAKDAGNLKSNEQMKVETKVVETQTVVIIEQANPQVVYVPSYNPVVVYGPPIYPYPPIYYPPPGYFAGAVIGFGVGIAIGAAWGGGWGYGCGWGRGHNNINININNNYISHYNKTNINNVNRNGNNNWQHDPQHRGGAPYSNKATANKYGGTTRGDSMSTRQANARQQAGRRPQTSPNNRGGNTANRAGANATNRPSYSGANRANSPGNNVGNRQVSSNNASRSNSAFGGASNKASAQATSSRGKTSMSSSRGSGGSTRSGGGRRR
jgi:hypothetical protein